MIAATTCRDCKLAIFGLGLSGLAAARSLIAGGAEVHAWDDSDEGRQAAQRAGVPLTDLRTPDWSQFAALVLSPGVPLTHPEPHWTVRRAREAGIEIIGDTEVFCRERARRAPDSTLVAITGTNGKSTTTALIAHLVRSAGRAVEVGGNIGEAILSLPDFLSDKVYVIEFSSYQLDLTPSLHPDIAILLNISADHLDRHGTIENYAQVKAKIFANMGVQDLMVVGVDDPYSREIAATVRGRAKCVPISISRSLDSGLYVQNDEIYEGRGGQGVPRADLAGIPTLRGRHNFQNAAAAYAAGSALGLGHCDIQAGLRSFPGLAHRMELVARRDHVLYVNDSKGTNADATSNALAAYRDIFWIAGGRAKAGGLASLEKYFPRIRKAYLIGEAATEFAGQLAGKVAHEIAGDLATAVDLASRDALKSVCDEAVVLLSPACASFDQFPSFSARGDAFRELVLKAVATGRGER